MAMRARISGNLPDASIQAEKRRTENKYFNIPRLAQIHTAFQRTMEQLRGFLLLKCQRYAMKIKNLLEE